MLLTEDTEASFRNHRSNAPSLRLNPDSPAWSMTSADFQSWTVPGCHFPLCGLGAHARGRIREREPFHFSFASTLSKSPLSKALSVVVRMKPSEQILRR